jgi:hypothetical protein
MVRYAITHFVKETGLRQLTFANQSRNHYNDRKEAEKAMSLYEEDLRAKILGAAANTLEVREVQCYDNGDAKGIYFPMRLRKVIGRPFLAICLSCTFKLHYAGDSEIDPRVDFAKHYPVYADETGTAFKAYYCAECVKQALEVQS